GSLGDAAPDCVALRRARASLKNVRHSLDNWARCSLTKHFAASFPAKPGQRLCISLLQAVRMDPPCRGGDCPPGVPAVSAAPGDEEGAGAGAPDCVALRRSFASLKN